MLVSVPFTVLQITVANTDIHTPKQVALHSQKREAAPVAATGITGPPEAGEEGLKGTWDCCT